MEKKEFLSKQKELLIAETSQIRIAKIARKPKNRTAENTGLLLKLSETQINNNIRHIIYSLIKNYNRPTKQELITKLQDRAKSISEQKIKKLFGEDGYELIESYIGGTK